MNILEALKELDKGKCVRRKKGNKLIYLTGAPGFKKQAAYAFLNEIKSDTYRVPIFLEYSFTLDEVRAVDWEVYED